MRYFYYLQFCDRAAGEAQNETPNIEIYDGYDIAGKNWTTLGDCGSGTKQFRSASIQVDRFFGREATDIGVHIEAHVIGNSLSREGQLKSITDTPG